MGTNPVQIKGGFPRARSFKDLLRVIGVRAPCREKVHWTFSGILREEAHKKISERRSFLLRLCGTSK